MIDFGLHFIVSVIIYILSYIVFKSHKIAFIVTIGIGISKEIIDSITHYAQLIDLVGDVCGILYGRCVICLKKLYL